MWQYPVADERPKFGQLVIPTLDSVRYEHLMMLVHSVGKVCFVALTISHTCCPCHMLLLAPRRLSVCAHIIRSLGRHCSLHVAQC